jgi:hypothetical protein
VRGCEARRPKSNGGVGWDEPDYDELEESLTVEELFLTYEALFKKERRFYKAIAAMWGSGVEDDDDDEGGSGSRHMDITQLNAALAANADMGGLGVGIGFKTVSE